MKKDNRLEELREAAPELSDAELIRVDRDLDVFTEILYVDRIPSLARVNTDRISLEVVHDCNNRRPGF